MEDDIAPTAIVDLQNASFRYPRGAAVLDNVNVAIHSGDRVALLGGNGSGKTTLMRILVGLMKADSGRLVLQGQPVGNSRKERARLRTAVQLVFQEPDDQIVATTVRGDVSFGPMNLRLDRAEVERRVESAMAAMAISDLADRAPHHLSFGQRKRVVIAGALAMEPDVLLLDEATAGLDPQAVHDLLRALTELTESGTAVVLATHEVDAAWSWAREALVLAGGTVHRGPVGDVLTDERLLTQARLTTPWGAAISRRLKRTIVHPKEV